MPINTGFCLCEMEKREREYAFSESKVEKQRTKRLQQVSAPAPQTLALFLTSHYSSNCRLGRQRMRKH